MAFTYDTSTDAGRVRLLIPDRTEATAVFTDAEIDAFLVLESGVYRAAALALETVASDTAATLRVTKVLGLEVDGTRASAELLKRAEKLRSQADEAESRTGDIFDWATMIVDDFSYREHIDAESLRSLP